MIIGDIGASSYDSSDLQASLATWNSIKESWNDNKSNEIEGKYYVNLRVLAGRLEELASQTQSEMNIIKNQLESI